MCWTLQFLLHKTLLYSTVQIYYCNNMDIIIIIIIIIIFIIKKEHV